MWLRALNILQRLAIFSYFLFQRLELLLNEYDKTKSAMEAQVAKKAAQKAKFLRKYDEDVLGYRELLAEEEQKDWILWDSSFIFSYSSWSQHVFLSVVFIIYLDFLVIYLSLLLLTILQAWPYLELQLYVQK